MTIEEFKNSKPTEELDKVVTMGVLLEYTHEVLLPSIDRMFEKSEERMKMEMGKLEHNLKSYIDDKLADQTADLVKRFDIRFKKQEQFMSRVIELFKRHNIGKPEDIAFLEGLAQ